MVLVASQYSKSVSECVLQLTDETSLPTITCYKLSGNRYSYSCIDLVVCESDGARKLHSSAVLDKIHVPEVG